MLRNLTLSVLRYERVKTTEAKAKEIRGHVDRLIGLGKEGTLSARRRARGVLPEAEIVEKLFTDLAPRYTTRTSGYVRVTRLGRRVGDNSQMMLLELMPGDADQAATAAAAAAEEKPRRRRLALPRRAAKTAEPAVSKAATTATKKAAAPGRKTTAKKKEKA
ncbi:MAG: 50S ribosomal protein L17 [Chloroflexi bacterium]|nr:50S ribosomal protein L17 [Chloroflexota bacterium]